MPCAGAAQGNVTHEPRQSRRPQALPAPRGQDAPGDGADAGHEQPRGVALPGNAFDEAAAAAAAASKPTRPGLQPGIIRPKGAIRSKPCIVGDCCRSRLGHVPVRHHEMMADLTARVALSRRWSENCDNLESCDDPCNLLRKKCKPDLQRRLVL